jgi:hypothetical protein
MIISCMKDDWEGISKEAFAAWLSFHVGICAQKPINTPLCRIRGSGEGSFRVLECNAL